MNRRDGRVRRRSRTARRRAGRFPPPRRSRRRRGRPRATTSSHPSFVWYRRSSAPVPNCSGSIRPAPIACVRVDRPHHVRHHAHRRVHLGVLTRDRHAGRAPIDERDEHRDRAEQTVAGIFVAGRRHRLVERAGHLVRRTDVTGEHRREALPQPVRTARSPTRARTGRRRRDAEARICSAPRPSRSAAPGRMLWCTTSAQSSNRSIAGCRPGSLRFTASERFPACAEKSGRSIPRSGSPSVGSSLITSAPRSASRREEYGPA